jgi:hypothetical protein
MLVGSDVLECVWFRGKAVERAEEMRRIFEAVKKQDCRPIICKNIKEKT